MWLYRSLSHPILLEIQVVFQCVAVTDSAEVNNALSATGSGLGLYFLVMLKKILFFYFSFECLNKIVLSVFLWYQCLEMGLLGHMVNKYALL